MRSSVPMELLESIIDLMEDGVIIALPDGAIAYHNQVILDLFGVAKDSTPTMLSQIGDINWSKRMNRAAFDAGSQYQGNRIKMQMPLSLTL